MSTIHGDYFFFDKGEDEENMSEPILVLIDSKIGMIKARMINKKGLNPMPSRSMRALWT